MISWIWGRVDQRRCRQNSIFLKFCNQAKFKGPDAYVRTHRHQWVNLTSKNLRKKASCLLNPHALVAQKTADEVFTKLTMSVHSSTFFCVTGAWGGKPIGCVRLNSKPKFLEFTSWNKNGSNSCWGQPKNPTQLSQTVDPDIFLKNCRGFNDFGDFTELKG